MLIKKIVETGRLAMIVKLNDRPTIVKKVDRGKTMVNKIVKNENGERSWKGSLKPMIYSKNGIPYFASKNDRSTIEKTKCS